MHPATHTSLLLAHVRSKLPSSALIILSMLAEQDRLRPLDIRKRTGFSNAAIGGAGDILAERKLIAKKRDNGDDQRAVYYELLPEGEKLIRSILAISSSTETPKHRNTETPVS